MEKNRHMLTLSSLGIGLLMVFYNDINTLIEFTLWIAAGALFLFCIFLSLRILSKNADYIQSDLTNDTETKKALGSSLKSKSKALDILFILAAVVTFSLSIAKSDTISVTFNFDKEEQNVER